MSMKTSVYENDLQSLQFKLPFRTDAGHKGDFGRCVVVGGSENYVGAPRFAAESAAEVLALTAEAAKTNMPASSPAMHTNRICRV